MFGNGQSEAGAAELAGGGGVHLLEFLKQQVLFVGGDADAGIRHAEAQADSLDRRIGLERFHPDLHLSCHRKFDGVADEVGEDLTKPTGVSIQVAGYFGGDVAGEGETFFSGAQGQAGGKLVE